jgi:tRNA(fMet)-specific endonuclease VapC
MAIVLLDTTVASFLHPKRRDTPQRRAYAPDLQGNVLALSFQSVAELLQWAEQNQWGQPQRHALARFISRFVVIPYDLELARVWAKVMTQTRARGRRLESGDAWIAATAVHRSIPLITHDNDLADLRVDGLTIVSHT